MPDGTLTFIVPTYNRAHLLERAIDSVFSQTSARWRLLICDNASSDDTPVVAGRYAQRDDRVIYQRHDTNIGPMGNFLYGLSRVETEFFSFLSDDDFLLPRMLEINLGNFVDFPDIMLSAAGTVEVDTAGNILFAPLAFWKREGRLEPPSSLDALMGGFHPSWTSVVFRTEVRDVLGAFYDDIRSVSDIEYTFRIASNYPIAISRETAGVFFRHPESAGDLPPDDIAEQYDIMLSRLLRMPKIDDASKAILTLNLPRQARYKLFQLGTKALSLGKVDTATKALKAFRKRGGNGTIAGVLLTLARLVRLFPVARLPILLAGRMYMRFIAARSRDAAHRRNVALREPEIRARFARVNPFS